jgi:hypothetical protein
LGKPSRIRPPEPAQFHSRYQEADGFRKLYDRDKMPDGCDPDVWHLTLYFEQKAEESGVTTAARPIIYVELSNRIRRSNIKSHADWFDVLEIMIDHFWDTLDDTSYAINTFTGIERFSYHYKQVRESHARKNLLANGTRKAQEDHEIQSSVSGHDRDKVRSILTDRRTSGESSDRIRKFREKVSSEHRA